MAEKKSRKFKTWRIKWLLLYIAIMILLVLAFVFTMIYLKDGTIKSLVSTYEIICIGMGIGIPIAAIIIHKKDLNNETQHLSKEEYDKYLKESKNCDIHAK